MKTTEEIIMAFRSQGNRITPQRRAIFEILVDNGSHPNAEAIYRQMLVKMPDISRTTVYNTLKELNQLGAVNLVNNIGEASSRYDPNTEDHHHIYCLKCHRICDLEQDFEGVRLSEQETAGYKIVKQQVTFFGYCPNCREE